MWNSQLHDMTQYYMTHSELLDLDIMEIQGIAMKYSNTQQQDVIRISTPS